MTHVLSATGITATFDPEGGTLYPLTITMRGRRSPPARRPLVARRGAARRAAPPAPAARRLSCRAHGRGPRRAARPRRERQLDPRPCHPRHPARRPAGPGAGRHPGQGAVGRGRPPLPLPAPPLHRRQRRAAGLEPRHDRGPRHREAVVLPQALVRDAGRPGRGRPRPRPLGAGLPAAARGRGRVSRRRRQPAEPAPLPLGPGA